MERARRTAAFRHFRIGHATHDAHHGPMNSNESMHLAQRLKPSVLASFALAAGALSSAASAQIGTTYCTAVPNSTGSIALISATGSTDVALNDVTLSVSSLPLNQFGLFVTSQTQAFAPNPGGSNGNLCVGGMIGRFNAGIVSSGATGSVSLALDLNAIAAPMGAYAVMPGDTVNFQLWHRDVAAPGFSNLSEGLEIQFDAAPALSFENDIYPMMTQPNINAPSCTTCHVMFGFCGLDLSSAQLAYDNLINIQASCCFPDTLVVPGDSAASVLYQKLTVPQCGGTMPQGGTFAGDTDAVRDWIDAGAPF